MRWLIEFSIRHRVVVAVLAVLGLVLGAWSLRRASLDVFPEFVPPQISIQTEAPGLSPELVDQLVTRPIEATVTGAPGVAKVRSESIPGLSVVTLTFAEGLDPVTIRQGVSERLASIATALPAGVRPPKPSPLTSSTMDMLKVGLVSRRMDTYGLRDLADLVLKPRFLGVPGVAHVNIFGGDVRQIQIQADPGKLAAYDLSLRDLSEAARTAIDLRGGGFIDLAAQRLLIDTPAPAADPAAIANSVIALRGGSPLRLGDVAEVRLAPALKVGDALVQARPGVLLTITGQFGANTLDTTRGVEAVLQELGPSLRAQGVEIYPALHRPANFIERALANLAQSLTIGGLLILVVLYLFLRDWRSALISFATIPLSLLAAVTILERYGATLNTMTLGGFAVALGVLVDDAIIGIENVLRRLRENAAVGSPRDRLDIIRDASLEIRSPVIYATLVVLLVFVPILLSTGVQGRFIGPLALAFMLAVVASLVVALTVTPALCALLISARDAHAEPRWVVALKAVHGRALVALQRRLWPVAAVLGVAFAAAVAILPLLGGEFMPAFREGHFVLQVASAVPGTSLTDMLTVGRSISRDVLALPFVATVEQQIGRAELGEDTWGTHRSEFHVELRADAKVDERAAQEQLRDILAAYPGIRSEVLTFLGDRISESLTGETAQVVVNLYGDNLDNLDAASTLVARAIAPVPGVVDLQVKRDSGTPMLAVRLDRDLLAIYGLSSRDALGAMQTAFAGDVVGQTYANGRGIDVAVMLPPALRQQPGALRDLMIGGPAGPVPLGRVADISVTDGRYSIQREGGQRRIAVTFNVSGRPLQSVVAGARAALQRVALPANVYLSIGGEAEAEQAARLELALSTVLVVIVTVIILYLAFRDRVFPWLVLVNVPFSLLGSIAAIALTGVGLTLGTLVGLVTVFGVGARNSLLLLSHYEHLVGAEGAPWDAGTIVRGARERLVPIVMTALVTALGLLPLAAGLGRAGHEIEGPMAITVLGGLATSTILNLLMLPELVRRLRVRTLPVA